MIVQAGHKTHTGAMRTPSFPLIGLVLLCAAACTEQATPVDTTSKADPESLVEQAATVNTLADRYYDFVLERAPEAAYFAAIDIDRHDGLYDNSPVARESAEAFEDELLADLEAIDIEALAGTAEWVTAALLSQQLNADVRTRVCRAAWWNVNQMGGWHSSYSQVAQLQPVDTQEHRDQALTRWQGFAGFVGQELANLKEGLENGYSAPKSVVQRVIDQVDGLLGLQVADSPYNSPGARSDDAEFSAAMQALVVDSINPALRAYRDYLANTYLFAAREELSITANPDGRACYDASLYSYTTLDRSAEEVYALGEKTVAANRARVIELGKAEYGIDDFVEIIKAAKADPADSFADKDELLTFSREMVLRAEKEMPNWVASMPTQAVEVVPFPEHEEGTGRSAHYRPGNNERPGEYRIPLYKPEDQSRGNAEATAFHEAWPGHHLQVASAQSVASHAVADLIWFSGPGEGWARYSEGLAEEMGLYQSKTGPILRRAWPARGMVVDPGIHLFGWTRKQAIDFMIESGRFPASAGDSLVDRIAILPGQLTAYDSGGLQILALRSQAEEELGDAFDVREFHDAVLQNGTIPLEYLRTHVEAWIATKAGEQSAN
jgi:uncharacterized protein (DUF885 family)